MRIMFQLRKKTTPQGGLMCLVPGLSGLSAFA